MSLTAAFEQLVEHVIMVERDEEVAAVWNTIMRDDGEWLAHEIMRFMLTPETVHKVLNQSELLVAVDLCDRARRNLGKSCSDNNHG